MPLMTPNNAFLSDIDKLQNIPIGHLFFSSFQIKINELKPKLYRLGPRNFRSTDFTLLFPHYKEILGLKLLYDL